MAYIEGIGDEVLLVFSAFFIVLIVLVAWVSTSVQEQRINLIVVDRDRFNQVIQRVRDAGYRITRFGHVNGNQPPVLAGGGVTPQQTENSSSNNAAESERTEATHSTSSVEDVLVPESVRGQDTGNTSLSNEGVVSSGDDSSLNRSESEILNSGKESKDEEQEQQGSGTASSQDIDGILAEENVTRSSENTGDGQEVPDSQNINTNNEGRNSSIEERESSQTQEDTEARESPSVSDNRRSRGTSQGEQMPGEITVNIRFLDDRQKIVQTRPQETIGQFKRDHFARELAQNLAVRLIFNGRELRPDSLPLEAYNIQNRSVIHCVVRQTDPSSNTEPAQVEEEELNLGTYILPLFGVILGLIWYSRFTYGKYFNAISTVALVGITFLYVVVFLASFRNNEDNNNIVEVHEHQD